MLLGTWRLHATVDGTVVQPHGDNPQGYLVYTHDGHVLVQFAVRERRELFKLTRSGCRCCEKTIEPDTELGYGDYCGTFEVHDDKIVHHVEFSVMPSLTGVSVQRSIVLNSDRLILATPRGLQAEWQRVR